MRIGIIFTAYNTEQYIGPSLAAWIRAKHMRFNGDDFTICAVSVPFKGFPNDEAADRTIPLLYERMIAGDIDRLITSGAPMAETEARGSALAYLIQQGVDTVVQVDSDEFFTLNEIDRIFTFVKTQPFVGWFRLCLKNFVFDAATYLTDPFTPARIHRVRFGPLTASHFVADNDIAYGSINPRDVASMTIPQTIAWVKHITWPSSLRSKKKCTYQRTRWGACSYRWNETESKLEFDPEYYKAHGLPLPTVARDAGT